MGDRVALGLAMQNWHSSMGDPIYAVGSYYFAGMVYPDRAIVENAITSFERMHDEYARMLRGEIVWVVRNGARVSLAKFAGFKKKEMRERLAEVEAILEALRAQDAEDYA